MFACLLLVPRILRRYCETYAHTWYLINWQSWRLRQPVYWSSCTDTLLVYIDSVVSTTVLRIYPGQALGRYVHFLHSFDGRYYRHPTTWFRIFQHLLEPHLWWEVTCIAVRLNLDQTRRMSRFWRWIHLRRGRGRQLWLLWRRRLLWQRLLHLPRGSAQTKPEVRFLGVIGFALWVLGTT